MVKNAAGGNKAKGQARKSVMAPKSTFLRLATDECEIYAQVTKSLGNGMCHVLCMDNVVRLCHIRGKFRGRGKRDNIISNGSWVMIGIREWEMGKKRDGKLQNCDLLEVYCGSDKERLKSTVTHLNWSAFIRNDNLFGNNEDIKDDVVGFKFADEATEEYQKIIEAQVAAETTMSSCKEEDVVDVSDI